MLRLALELRLSWGGPVRGEYQPFTEGDDRMFDVKPATARLANSIPEVAEQLGVSESFIWAELKNGALNSVRLGKRRLITQEQLNQYLRKNAA
jgi:excisionase family DNA binding protein